MSRKTSAKSIAGPWIYHTLEMRLSPAWRHLPDDSRRFLDALEIEHMEHGGAENGRLIRTYADLRKAPGKPGIRKSSIPLAIRQAVALGFVQVTQEGQRSAAQFRNPSTYRLTYVNGRGKAAPRTDDWKRMKTDEQALEALKRAVSTKRQETQRPVRVLERAAA